VTNVGFSVTSIESLGSISRDLVWPVPLKIVLDSELGNLTPHIVNIGKRRDTVFSLSLQWS
jgi:hypothetical protein